MPSKPPKPGAIYWLKQPGRITHPHVVISIEGTMLRLCAITTNGKKAKIPGNVILDAGEANLEKISIIEVSKIVIVESAMLGAYIGSLSDARLKQILNGLNFVQASFLRQ